MGRLEINRVNRLSADERGSSACPHPVTAATGRDPAAAAKPEVPAPADSLAPARNPATAPPSPSSTVEAPAELEPEPAGVAVAPTANEAAAFVLGKALGLSEDLPSLLAGLRARLEPLHDPTAPAALAELKRQLPVLEALFLRFSVEALKARRPDHQATLLRTALQAQQAYSRTLALLHTLPRSGSVAVVVSAGGGNDLAEEV